MFFLVVLFGTLPYRYICRYLLYLRTIWYYSELRSLRFKVDIFCKRTNYRKYLFPAFLKCTQALQLMRIIVFIYFFPPIKTIQNRNKRFLRFLVFFWVLKFFNLLFDLSELNHRGYLYDPIVNFY